MSYGSTSQVINSARMRISRGSSEVSLASDVTVTSSRIVDRTVTRAGPVDTVRWVLVEVSFTAVLTELLLNQLKADAAVSGALKPSYTNWTVAGAAVSGSSGDDTSEVYSCTMLNYEVRAPETGAATAVIKLRALPVAG